MKELPPTNAWVHPVIAGVLLELPHPSKPFPKAKRDAFMKAFAAVLEFVYDRNAESEGESHG